jgi:hypothetical protein
MTTPKPSPRTMRLEAALHELEWRGVRIEHAREYAVTANADLSVTLLERDAASEPRFRWTEHHAHDDALPVRGTRSWSSLTECLECAFEERFGEAVRIIGD